MTIEEMRGLDALKTYKELEEALKRIKRLEEAGDRMYWTLEDQETGSVGKEMWLKAKGAKP